MIRDPHASYIEADGRRWNFWTAELSNFQAASDYLRYRILMDLLPAARGTVLDVGCGDGYLDFLLHKGGCTPIGLDLSTSRLEKARRGQVHEFRAVQSNCYSLPLAENSCDTIIYSEILEHLEKPQEAIRSGARILKPGGRLIVSVPHAQDAPDVVCPHCMRQFNAAGHVQHFQSADLQAIIESTGLKTLTIFAAASAATRYLLRRMTWTWRIALPMDVVFRKLIPGDNLHLFAVAVKPSTSL
jgi:2-polyprenyl-3-methyl-5-hydroxy-6-metoxy-1,4-benzoquinol methylase